MSETAYPIFVLTMEGDEARRAPLVAWLEAHGLDHELFYGVDGRSGLAPRWEASIDRAAAARRLGRRMGDGEFACALSHQEIYRSILERGLPGAVVLEDDAVPGEDFARFLRSGACRTAAMLLLDHANTRAIRGSAMALPGGFVGHRVAMPPFYATAYTVDARAAAFLRDNAFPIAGVADWPCDISRIGAIAVMPRPVGHRAQGTGPSHLHGERRERQRRAHRFLSPGYWRNWWRKRRAVRLPDEGV